MSFTPQNLSWAKLVIQDEFGSDVAGLDLDRLLTGEAAELIALVRQVVVTPAPEPAYDDPSRLSRTMSRGSPAYEIEAPDSVTGQRLTRQRALAVEFARKHGVHPNRGGAGRARPGGEGPSGYGRERAVRAAVRAAVQPGRG